MTHDDLEFNNSHLPMDDSEQDYPERDGDGHFLPLLPLRNTILFPGLGMSVSLGRSKSIEAVRAAFQGNRMVAVAMQRRHDMEEPNLEDLYQMGTVARVTRLFRLPDGTWTANLVGRRRVRLDAVIQKEPYFIVDAVKTHYDAIDNDLEFEAILSVIKEKVSNIMSLMANEHQEAELQATSLDDRLTMLYYTASHLNTELVIKQQLLELNSPGELANRILVHLDADLKMLELRETIENKVRTEIEKQQRDYYLNQQLRTIQDELGQNPVESDLQKIRDKADNKKWPKAAADHFNRELNKLQRMNSQAPEYSVQINYLELMVDLPWESYVKDNFDLKKVQKTLDKDHYGLEDVKKRIIEHLAVLKLKGDMKAPILCLVGPPGVGKTSLGRSIANALGRGFTRMSLGGLHDESEIRGHRKTYIGAMPGRILQSLRKAGSGNPVFILDEIDKVGKDFRGDPQSALLEVLDPEQNGSFHDNYLDFDYDLSKVLFIATANSLSSIQPALLDRMEVIELNGYSLEEKIEIARQHLIPSQRTNHGLKTKDVTIKPDVLAKIIADYTRESGVRSLDRQIASVMRNIAGKVALKETYNQTLQTADLQGILGIARFSNDIYEQTNTSGVAVGLAWTSVGGDILFIEATKSRGKGRLTLTGNLGDVMKESATTALSYLKSYGEMVNLSSVNFEEQDIHVHVPEGAIPKDGPSAGITMLSAIASALTDRPIKPFLAMTGEITLRGKVLPVGGIKEKILAARRAGLREVVLCKDNRRHVEELNPKHIEGLSFHYVDTMTEVLHIAIGLP
jgi:ATP-dependent Lon protease